MQVDLGTHQAPPTQRASVEGGGVVHRPVAMGAVVDGGGEEDASGGTVVASGGGVVVGGGAVVVPGGAK